MPKRIGFAFCPRASFSGSMGFVERSRAYRAASLTEWLRGAAAWLSGRCSPSWPPSRRLSAPPFFKKIRVRLTQRKWVFVGVRLPSHDRCMKRKSG